MPYKIQKKGIEWVIINTETNKVVGKSRTKANAEASIRARLAGKHSWGSIKKSNGER